MPPTNMTTLTGSRAMLGATMARTLAAPAPAAAAPASPSAAGPPATAPPALTTLAAARPALTALRPDILRVDPDILRHLIPAATKTTTQLARGAVSLLNGAARETLDETLRTLIAKGRDAAAANLMNYLERKVKIGEVFNELATRWSAETVTDFASAFQMEASKTAVMDLIVAVSILNDPQLDDQLRIENQPQVTDGDLMQNRRVVWQYPPPGTALEPPYIVLLAVEHDDPQAVEDVVNAILGQLVTHQNYKLPRPAAERVGFRG
jgi:hypothetical protein